jgi:transcriptional regulator
MTIEYNPAHFREQRQEVLLEFIERHPLGVLVTVADGRPNADHLPMLLDRERGPCGALRGHVARANPIWRHAGNDTDVLVIFSGADAYVSPSWYASKAATGKVVPTWNYSVVHVRGRIRFVHEAHELRELVGTLTDVHEGPHENPWAVDDAPNDYVEAQLRAIVGFEIEIREVVGKFKASQNRTAEDRAGVRSGLAVSRDSADLAELVREPRSSQD